MNRPLARFESMRVVEEGEEAIVVSRTRSLNRSGLNAKSLKHGGESIADRAVSTWNGVASTIEDVAARAQTVTHDARNDAKVSIRKAQKNAEQARKNAQKVRKNARKQMTEASKNVKSARRETARRTGAARDALAGRKRHRGLTAVLTVAGVGVGAVLGAAAARMSRRDDTATINGMANSRVETARPTADRYAVDQTVVENPVDKLEAHLADAVTSAKAALPPPSRPIPTASPTVPKPTVAGAVNGTSKERSKSADQIG